MEALVASKCYHGSLVELSYYKKYLDDKDNNR